MIFWREGKAGFVGGAKRLIKGVFQPQYSVTSADVAVPDKTFGLFSKISTVGTSILTSLTGAGAGVLSSIDESHGMSSNVNNQGDAVFSTIISDGNGVFSLLDGSEGIFSKMNSQGVSIYSIINSGGKGVESEL